MNPIYILLTPSVFMGMCIYAECTPTFMNTQSDVIAELLAPLLPPGMHLQLAFYDDADIVKPIRDDVRTGYIVTTTVVCVIGAICVLGLVVECTGLFSKNYKRPKNDK